MKLINILRILLKITASLIVAVSVVEYLNYKFVWDAPFWEAVVTMFLFIAVLGVLSEERF